MDYYLSTKFGYVRNYLLGKVVKGYMVGDLKRMLAIKVKPNHDGNCNFPIALYTFTCMDFLGYLIAKEEYRLNGDTEKRIRAYINIAFTDKDKELLQPYMEHFVNKFRNGLGHEFFPKMAGISRVTPHIMSWHEKGDKGDGYWVLDTDRLAEMFFRSVARLEGLIGNEKLAIRIFDRHQKMLSKNLDLQDIPVNSFLSPTALNSFVTTTTMPLGDDNSMIVTPTSKGDTGSPGLTEIKP